MNEDYKPVPLYMKIAIDKIIAGQGKSEGLKQREAFAKLELAELEALHAMCADGMTRVRLRVAASNKATPEGKAAYERMSRAYYRNTQED